MSKRAAGVYRPNADTIRLHQRIIQLRQNGLVHEEIADKIPMSVSSVKYHLRDACNCRNGTGVRAAEPSRQAQ